MSNTVQQFAAELKKSVPTLLEQLKAAGVEKAVVPTASARQTNKPCWRTCANRTTAAPYPSA